MITSHDMDQPAPPDCLWHLIACPDRADANLLRHLHGCADLLAAQLGGHVDALLNRSSAAQSNASRAALVHCIAGQSRSCTIVAAFLVRERGLTLREAMRQIQHRRPSASPNRGFWRQLVAFERGCRRGEASYEEAELPGSVMFEREELDRIIAAHKGDRRRSVALLAPGQPARSARPACHRPACVRALSAQASQTPVARNKQNVRLALGGSSRRRQYGASRPRHIAVTESLVANSGDWCIRRNLR